MLDQARQRDSLREKLSAARQALELADALAAAVLDDRDWFWTAQTADHRVFYRCLLCDAINDADAVQGDPADSIPHDDACAVVKARAYRAARRPT